MDFPEQLDVEIEVPRGGFVKRRDDGSVDYVSPLPSPFNYGSVPGTRSGDGDRLDALVLGPALPRGVRVRLPVVARVDFEDDGADDPKYVCSRGPLTPSERLLITAFFTLYGRAKTVLNRARGRRGATRFVGLTSALRSSLR